MVGHQRLGILSDVHYASAAEQARGSDYEFQGISNSMLRLFLRLHRRFVWLHEPLQKNYLLDRFIERADSWDYVIANGDYSCDSAFVGVSDGAACQSAHECLSKLRTRFGANFRANFGDHELGKMSFFGGQGGMRLASWRCAREQLTLDPFWQLEIGNYLLMGVTSSLIALPVFEPDTLAEERPHWNELREAHLAQIREAFDGLRPVQRVVLFCHDPSALPFLARETAVFKKLPQIEQTIIGHLHSGLIFWKSQLLAGMPKLQFLGHTAKRMTAALNEARFWRPFNVRLCPSLAGIELLKDGGFLSVVLDPAAQQPARFVLHRLGRA